MTTGNHLEEILALTVAETKAIFSSAFYGAFLYGSYARGDYDEESDIDILILVDLPAEDLAYYREQIDHLSGRVLFDYGIVLSILEKDLETFVEYQDVLPFYQNILREGQQIA